MLTRLLLVALFVLRFVASSPPPQIISPANFTSYPSGSSISFSLSYLDTSSSYELTLYDFEDAHEGEYFAIQVVTTNSTATTAFATVPVPSLFSGSCAVSLTKIGNGTPDAFVILTVTTTLEFLSPLDNIIYTAGKNITLSALGRGQSSVPYIDNGTLSDSYLFTSGYLDCPALNYSQVPVTFVFDLKYNGFTSRNPDDLSLPFQLETPNLAMFNISITVTIDADVITLNNITLLPQNSTVVPGLPSI